MDGPVIYPSDIDLDLQMIIEIIIDMGLRFRVEIAFIGECHCNDRSNVRGLSEDQRMIFLQFFSVFYIPLQVGFHRDGDLNLHQKVTIGYTNIINRYIN